MKAKQKWGCFRIQMRGNAKWTTLRSQVPMYYGHGYQQTRDQAAAVAVKEIERLRLENPNRELRIKESLP